MTEELPRTSKAGPEDRLFAFTQIADLSVAIDALTIREVLLDDANPGHLDLAAYFQVEAATGVQRRRVILVQTDDGTVHLRIGEQMTVQSVAAREVFGLPVLVGATTERVGVAAVIARSSGISYVLSPSKMIAEMERADRSCRGEP